MSAPSGSAASLSTARVSALVLRHWYLLTASWPRLLELVYWPAVQMIMWGFLQLYVAQSASTVAFVAGTFIAGALLWDILFRGQLGFSVSFLEEVWSRNLGNLLMSPLRASEFVAGLMIMSLIRLGIGMVPVTILAVAFFGFNLWGLGLGLAAFFANLILTSWAVGLLVAGLILRHGLGAESLAWTFMFLIMPLVCVYYPVAVLPQALQWVAWSLPPTYVFEGLRALVVERVFRTDLMLWGLALNAVAFAAAWIAFVRLLEVARREGALMQTGE